VGDLLFRWTIRWLMLNVCEVIFTSSFTSKRLASQRFKETKELKTVLNWLNSQTADFYAKSKQCWLCTNKISIIVTLVIKVCSGFVFLLVSDRLSLLTCASYKLYVNYYKIINWHLQKGNYKIRNKNIQEFFFYIYRRNQQELYKC